MRNFLRYGCWRDVTLVCAVAAYEKNASGFPEVYTFTMVETRGIEPLDLLTASQALSQLSYAPGDEEIL